MRRSQILVIIIISRIIRLKMLRFAQRSNKSKTASAQSIVSQSARGAKSSVLVPDYSPMSKEKNYFRDVYGTFESHLGMIWMNKEHKHNLLSPGFAADVQRGVQSMYQENHARVIYMASENHKVWSNGTDFRTIRHMKQEENYEAIQNYMQQIYQLQTRVAAVNKPIVGVASGQAFNSGASLLAACSQPLVTQNCRLAFNECVFGFVPHSGASYYLSRLPGEFGTFMALTGLPIKGADAYRAGLVEGVLDSPVHFHEDIVDAVRATEEGTFDPQHQYWEQDFAASRRGAEPYLSPWEQWLRKKSESKADNSYRDMERFKNKDGYLDEYSKFSEAKDRLPSSVAEAEYKYMQLLRKDAEKHRNNEGEGYLEWGQNSKPWEVEAKFRHTNFFQLQQDLLKMRIGHSVDLNRSVAIQHSALIARCFYADSLDQIRDNLSRESSPFAKECLEAMDRNSELSMKLALQMLRKAQNLDYTSALQMEVDVAMNMVKHKDFDIGVSKIIMSPKPSGRKFRPNPGFQQGIKDRDVESFFEPSPQSKGICVGAVQYALLPTRHFYERFSDHVRLWINEESTNQDDVRNRFDDQAKDALREIGIDVRDKALTMESARKHIAARLAMERVGLAYVDRQRALVADPVLREAYFSKAQDEVKRLKSDDAAWTKEVDGIINGIFEKAFMEKLEKIESKSREAQKLEKRRMLVRLKKFIFRSRFMKSQREEDAIQLQRLKNFPFKNIHLAEDWDKSWRDMEHPQIASSPLYHLSKAVGRVSLTPLELTREYLTNPDARDKMTVLTLDKDELLRLQEDVFNDPLKYRKMFESVSMEDELRAEHVRSNHDPIRKRARLENYDYWYRVLNDGYTKLDTIPYVNRLNAYKDWMEGIEEKAVDTLKQAINSLLISLQDDKTKTFKRSKAKTKRQQIEDLMAAVTQEQESISESKASPGKKEQAASLKSATRSLTDLESAFDEALTKDPALKGIFDLALGHENPMIEDFQAKAKSELLKLLEIVLLDKYSDGTDRKSLEQRLGSLLSPKGLDPKQQTSEQLRLIDEYLASENAQSVISEALDLVKPFYLAQMQRQIVEQAHSLAGQLGVDDTGDAVLNYYYLNRLYPDFKHVEYGDKFFNYNKKRENLELAYEVMPELDPRFKEKELLANFAEPETDPRESLESQKQKSMENTKHFIGLLGAMKTNYSKLNSEIDKQVDQQRQRLGDKDDVRNLEVFWTPAELAELKLWEVRQGYVKDFLKSNAYEIQNHFDVITMLKIYSDAILKYDMDMDSMIQLQQLKQGGAVGSAPKRRDQEWDRFAEYAKFLTDFATMHERFSSDPTCDLTQFMSTTGGSLSPSSESIYQQAMEAQNRAISEGATKTKVDRATVIRNEIADFNRLQELAKRRAELTQVIKKRMQGQSQQSQALIQDALERPQSYIDYEHLADELQAGKDILSMPTQKLIDTDRLMADLRRGKGPQAVREALLDEAIDVVSLAESKAMLESDQSMGVLERKQMSSIIDHVSAQTQCLDNEVRKSITLRHFLHNNHYSSPASYTGYSSDLLQTKLETVLGKKPTEAASVDWQLGEFRTQPLDHLSPDSEEQIEKFLQAVQGGREEPDPKIEVFNQVTQKMEYPSVREEELRNVIRDASVLTELPSDAIAMRNVFANRLLQEMINPESAEGACEDIISEYMQARLKQCMVNATFSSKIKKSQNGHYYLKVLRERVLEELNLTKQATYTDLSFKTQWDLKPENYQHDLEAAYNMEQVTGTSSMGYDRVSETGAAVTATEKFEASQQTVMDKLLADYFLGRRGEYAESNKVMQQLTKVFEEKRGGQDSSGDGSFSQELLHQNRDKEDSVKISPEAAKSIMDLDIITSRALQNNKNGLSESLRALSIDETDHKDWHQTQIPEYFDGFDAKKPTEVYVKDKLYGIVDQAFQVRRKLEKNMSRRELVAFDKVLMRYLQASSLQPMLEQAVTKDLYTARQLGSEFGRYQDTAEDREAQGMKFEHDQREFNRSIKDPDAPYKQIAFMTMEDRKNEEIMKQKQDLRSYAHESIMYADNTFERWYARVLEEDAKKSPRTIDPADYEPKKFIKPSSEELPTWKSASEREEQFFRDHSLYLENKKENLDRSQLFYVLEQFFEHSRQNNKAQSSKADQAMRDYFADPENTFFFDQNKIV